MKKSLTSTIENKISQEEDTNFNKVKYISVVNDLNMLCFQENDNNDKIQCKNKPLLPLKTI